MRGRPLRALALLALLGLAAAGAGVLFLQARGIAPRALAQYVGKRVEGHNPTIVAAGAWSAATLMALDRGAGDPYAGPAPDLGLRLHARALEPGLRQVLVSSADEARRAIATALPGDAITFLPGTYRFHGAPLAALAVGSEGQPIK